MLAKHRDRGALTPAMEADAAFVADLAPLSAEALDRVLAKLRAPRRLVTPKTPAATDPRAADDSLTDTDRQWAQRFGVTPEAMERCEADRERASARGRGHRVIRNPDRRPQTMTALADNYARRRHGADPILALSFAIGVAASTTIYKGLARPSTRRATSSPRAPTPRCTSWASPRRSTTPRAPPVTSRAPAPRVFTSPTAPPPTR